jgi:chaperonin cofactor prefoldin
MQHCTKVPLLLTNIRKYTEDPEERQQLTEVLEKLDNSLKGLENKMKWLKNFERVQEIQQQIIWQPITELEPRYV